MPDLHQLKRCSLCGKVLKESSFRYIKYFNKRRTICKRCEAQERHKKRRVVEKHVQEHGVTPGIHKRLEREASWAAQNQATETVFSSLPPQNIKKYRWVKRVSQIGGVMLFVSILFGVFFGLFGLVVQRFGWLALALLVLAGVVAVVGQRYFNRRYADPIDSEIERHKRSIYPVLFQEQLQERLEYERFYRSPEWRILKDIFLRRKKKENGYYVCEICLGTIWQDVTVDHFKPRSKFPDLALEITNLRVVHRRCNSSKGDTIVGEE